MPRKRPPTTTWIAAGITALTVLGLLISFYVLVNLWTGESPEVESGLSLLVGLVSLVLLDGIALSVPRRTRQIGAGVLAGGMAAVVAIFVVFYAVLVFLVGS